MSKKAAFTQASVTRAIRGAQAAGVRVTICEIDPNGKIIIKSASAPREAGAGNSWDDVQ